MLKFNQKTPQPPVGKVNKSITFIATEREKVNVVMGSTVYDAYEVVIRPSEAPKHKESALRLLQVVDDASVDIRLVTRENLFDEVYLIPHSFSMYRKKSYTFLLLVTHEGNFIVPIGVTELSYMLSTGVGIDHSMRLTTPIKFWGKDMWVSSSFTGDISSYKITPHDLIVGRSYLGKNNVVYTYIGLSNDGKRLFLNPKYPDHENKPIIGKQVSDEYEFVDTDKLPKHLELQARLSPRPDWSMSRFIYHDNSGRYFFMSYIECADNELPTLVAPTALIVDGRTCAFMHEVITDDNSVSCVDGELILNVAY